MTTSEQLNIEVVIPSIGAVIHGVDLSQRLTSDQKHALEQALYKHHVLFFRNQNLTPEQQRDFAFEFGSTHVHPIFSHTGPCPEVSVLEFGQGINSDKRPGADKWHTDVSWTANPPIIGMLYAKIIPKHGGGDTLWANMVDIYKHEISDEMKQTLSKLTAQHSFESGGFKLQLKSNPADIEQYRKAVENNPPVNHPVIREHPHTKEKYLYVNSDFTTKINELNKDESDVLLKHLFSLVNKRPEFVCRWKWSENDVCIWDERTTQHYATVDYWPQHRKMHRCAITEREDKKDALEQALYKHHVLFFRNQNLTLEQQRDFALQFGPAHVHPIFTQLSPSINATLADIDKYRKAVEKNSPVTHRAIREHPHTKGKYLYVNSDFTIKINEFKKDGSDLLLKHVFSLVTKRPEFMCRWKWSENDVCLWDELTTQHYATTDYWPQHRKIYRCALTENEDKN